MDPQKPPPPPPPEGCLTVAVRVPVRIVALVLVLPVRMAWDALAAAGRFLHRAVLRPLGRILLLLAHALLVLPCAALWRRVLVPAGKALAWLGRVLVAVPLGWLYTYLLTPLGHALAGLARGTGAGLAWLYARVLAPAGRGAARLLRGIGLLLAAAGAGVYAAVSWLARYLLVVPARWLYAGVLAPAGRALAWLVGAVATALGAALYRTARVLLVLPALVLWRRLLAPAGRALAVVAREIGDALGHAWRVAGRVSRAVGRILATLFRWILVEPLRWVYRTVLTPAGHLVRDLVLRPAAEAARGVGRSVRQALATARDTVRQARADLRRALFGEPPRPASVGRRELRGRATRTLDSSTTALTKD
ncbi:hypothetical protein AQJ66_18515 [Streptomyces bungoensis]|uniref:Uncharacterized protein n=1 Tax=Streptomyces bungoensis TaxID=285568 RepID=A0A101T0M6_9ACTN|nr:hypothetical protein [Streptomyces bungoensis]KUN83604.1 hypothetical protein AQJ66_18515 [Streptomyces bungoensis]